MSAQIKIPESTESSESVSIASSANDSACSAAVLERQDDPSPSEADALTGGDSIRPFAESPGATPESDTAIATRVLAELPDGVVILDERNRVLWANACFRRWVGPDYLGQNIYAALNSDGAGADCCPLQSVLATGETNSLTIRSLDNRHYRLQAAPFRDEAAGSERATKLLATVRNVTSAVLQQNKLSAINRAGVELANIRAEELQSMSVEDRIELLKSNILHFTQDLLRFDVVEIRLLDSETGKLEPLLSVGLVPEATGRALYAKKEGNGVTGWVAATGISYLCDDTTKDKLYLEGAKDAKSSLTVPLKLHDKVIGTFNVESPKPRAFSESDLQLLEFFTRDVAIALNTLELLVAEKASAAAASVEAIHSAVALPVDDILSEAVQVMERFIGHESDVAQRLKTILRHARDIKQVIQKVGEKMAPTQAHPQVQHLEQRPRLKNRQVLVVDSDNAVRLAAHSLLDRFGCVVETARDGAEAICMARNLRAQSYDVVIADIRLPDMNGYEFLVKLKEIVNPAPLILMTGYGYDPSHTIPNARRAGHPPRWILYKPFRLDQLLDTVDLVIAAGQNPVAQVAPEQASVAQVAPAQVAANRATLPA